MEFKETKTKPESTRALLRQQVESQSELCDFTVIYGLWSRRFHSSVLVASPFFQCLFEHNFQEKVRGSVEMQIGTQATLNASLMFLYGKCPKIDMENVAYFLEIAEFLLIPNLKSLCVKWLKTKKVEENNFLKLLRMSSLYEFEITSCNEYIKQHLEDILNGEQVVSFTKDTLVHLFSDRTLTYVTMETKFKFLIRWTKQCFDRRQRYFDELLPLIDLHEVNQTTLDTAISDQDLKGAFNDDLAGIGNVREDNVNHIVLVANSPSSDESFWIFDTVRESWYRYEITGTLDRNCVYSEIKASKGVESSVIYRTTQNYDHSPSIYIQDVENGTVTKTELSTNSRNEQLAIESETCFALMEELVKKDIGQARSDDALDAVRRQMQLMAILGGASSVQQVLMASAFHNSTSRSSMTVSVLYKGHINENGHETVMIPVLSVPSESGMKLCVNKSSVIAMFLSSKESVLLYDVNECQLEKVFVKRDYNCTICATDTGFVLLNDKRIVYISRTQGPSLVEKYQTREMKLDSKENANGETIRFNYSSVGNRLIRYWRSYAYRTEDQPHILEYALHDNVMACASIDEANWKSMPLPRESGDTSIFRKSIFRKLVAISLPKSKLRCHVSCPHCDLLKEEKRNTSPNHYVYRNASPAYMWDTDDDSDNNYYYEPDYDYYGYDSDDYYYDSD